MLTGCWHAQNSTSAPPPVAAFGQSTLVLTPTASGANLGAPQGQIQVSTAGTDHSGASMPLQCIPCREVAAGIRKRRLSMHAGHGLPSAEQIWLPLLYPGERADQRHRPRIVAVRASRHGNSPALLYRSRTAAVVLGSGRPVSHIHSLSGAHLTSASAAVKPVVHDCGRATVRRYGVTSAFISIDCSSSTALMRSVTQHTCAA